MTDSRPPGLEDRRKKLVGMAGFGEEVVGPLTLVKSGIFLSKMGFWEVRYRPGPLVEL